MDSHLDYLLSEQSKRSRSLNRIYWIIGAIFVCSSVALLVYETQYLWLIPVIVALAIIVKLGVVGMEFDPEEPDGGENKAKANGCFFFIAFSIMGIIALSVLFGAMAATVHWELVLGFFISTGACIWIFLESREFTARRYPSIWRLEYECGVCESEMYRDNQYHCPACNFVSKGKKRHGLKRHIRKAHTELDQQINLFRKVCSDCLQRDESK